MKKNYNLCLLLFTALVYNTALAQEIQWQNVIGGNLSDVCHTIRPTADGGYICGGFSSSSISGDKTENVVGGHDYWVVKLDAAGNIQWQNTIGGNSGDQLTVIYQTPDGGYICGGHSVSNISGDKTENCLGQADYWVVKLDVSGNIQWQNTIGGNAYDYLYSLALTSDGGYMCAGTSNSNISGDKTENCWGSNDYWVVKLDAAGNIQWQNTIGGNGVDVLNSIAQTADGGYICGGESASIISGDKTENCYYAGISDYWVIKLDASGNIQWQNTIGGTNFDELNVIIQTSDGNYLCGGSSLSTISGDKSESNYGYSDFWILKLDAAGNILWQNTVGGNGSDWLLTLSETITGGFVCAGNSNSDISVDKAENCWGGDDYWMVVFDSAGNILSQNTIGGDTTEELHSIVPTADGGFIFGGSSQSNLSGDKTEACLGYMDYWIVKLTWQFNSITGALFADLNSNNIQDTGEPDIANYRVNESTTGRFTFSAPDGHYSLTINDTGNFSVVPSGNSYFNSAPSQHAANFNAFNQTDSLNGFGLQPVGSFNDLCVSITPPHRFRPGFNSTYQIHYVNAGTTILSPTIIFRKNNFLSHVSSTVAPFSITADSIVWNLSAIAPFQQGTISVTLNVNIGTPIGTPVVCYARIEPIIGDVNPGCNFGGWEPPLAVTASYDPNEIVVNRDSLTLSELTSSPFLHYIIYFQNTGNDTAFTVRVEDVLPLSLDASTMELISLSHAGNVQYDPLLRKVIFQFNNILLPDSNVDEPQSNGYIHYRIKPFTTLMVGDTIQNQAGIYFDFNAAVITNTAQTHIILITDVEKDEANNSVLIYPNPARDELVVGSPDAFGQDADMKSSAFGDKDEITIFNAIGKKFFSQKLTARSQQQIIDVSGLPRGIYFIKVNLEEKIVLQKIVLM